MKTFKFITYIQSMDLTPLTVFKSELLDNRNKIIDDWVYSHRMTDLLLKINLSPEEFKTNYAISIFDFFMQYFNCSLTAQACPTAKRFIHDNKENEGIIQIAVLICTEIKNQVLKSILYSDKKTNEKDEAFEIISDLFDSNLSIILRDYSNYINETTTLHKNKLKILESSTIISKTDKDGFITFTSPSLCKILGYKQEEMLGRTFNFIRHPDIPDIFYEKMWKVLKSGEIWKGRIKNINRDNETIIFDTTIIPDKDFTGEIIGYTAIKNDLTYKIFGEIDALTKLMNRSGFDKIYNKIYKKSLIHNKPFSMIMTDIDNFKTINDNYGHLVGDSILREFASILTKTVRPSDIVSRWGGEEFIILLPNTTLENALKTANRIRLTIEKNTFENDINRTASFGVATLKEGYKDAKMFLSNVDKSLYAAKTNGKNCVYYFDDINKDKPTRF